jgi:flagellar basal body-associated protein FliL
MKSKLKIIIPVLIIALGGAYKFVLAKPKAEAKPKVAGTVYIMPREFLLNLADHKYAKLDVALVLKEPVEAPKEAATPPDGYGLLPQEAVVRAIVTDTLTDRTADDLTSEEERTKLTKLILKRIKKQTDVDAEDVLLTDVAVQ